MRALDIDEQKWPPRQAAWFINEPKGRGQASPTVAPGDDLFQITHKRIYEGLRRAVQQAGGSDFAELLLRSHELWLNRCPSCSSTTSERFQHVLVDEFQDTNTIQYAWLRVLAGKTTR